MGVERHAKVTLGDFLRQSAGSYEKEPVRIYREFQLKAGACFIDQWIPENPLSMKDRGYDEDTARTATTGAEEIIRDDMDYEKICKMKTMSKQET